MEILLVKCLWCCTSHVIPLPTSSFPLNQGTHISWPRDVWLFQFLCHSRQSIIYIVVPPIPSPAVLYVEAGLIKHQWVVVRLRGVAGHKSLGPADDNVLTRALSPIKLVLWPIMCSTHKTNTHIAAHLCTSATGCSDKQIYTLYNENGKCCTMVKNKSKREEKSMHTPLQTHFYCRKCYGSMAVDRRRIMCLCTHTQHQHFHKKFIGNHMQSLATLVILCANYLQHINTQ